jgi:hypothetical protein
VGKFPTWLRPDLSDDLVASEANRLAQRPGLTAAQVRADLIIALGNMSGDTSTQRRNALATATGINGATISNAVMGRQPIYSPLLQRLYGREPGRTLLPEYAGPVTDFGPLTEMAVAAGLIDPSTGQIVPVDPAPINSNSGAGVVLPTCPPAPVAVAAPSPLAATAPEPAPAAQTTSSVPEQAAAGGGPVAGSHPGGDGEGEGSAPAAPPHLTAGEGSRSDGATPPPSFLSLWMPVEDPLDAALAALAQLAELSAVEAAAAKLVHSEAFERWTNAQAKAEAAKKAYDDLDALRPIAPTPAQQVAA